MSTFVKKNELNGKIPKNKGNSLETISFEEPLSVALITHYLLSVHYLVDVRFVLAKRAGHH
jgi:hypothetical protein